MQPSWNSPEILFPSPRGSSSTAHIAAACSRRRELECCSTRRGTPPASANWTCSMPAARLLALLVPPCPPHGRSIGTRVRFGQPEAAKDLAQRHLGQVLLLLLLAAEGVNGIHAQARLHADERAHPAVAAL